MENRRPEFALVVLASLFLTLIILGFFMQGKIIEVVQVSFASLQVDQEVYPLKVGIIPFQVFLFALALICVDIVNEFFGKREAIYLAFAGAGTIAFVWLLLKGVTYIPTVENQTVFDEAYATIFDLSKRSLAALSASIFFGFSIIAIIFELFRKWTHNGFAIIRLFMAHVIGLAFFVAIDAGLREYVFGSFGAALALAITRYIQWFILSILLIPTYYFLKIPFRLIIGKHHYDTVKERFAKKKVVNKEKKKDFFAKRQQLQEKRI